MIYKFNFLCHQIYFYIYINYYENYSDFKVSSKNPKSKSKFYGALLLIF